MENTIIGISGFARSGKDTFASMLCDRLSILGVDVKLFSFANKLKSDIDDFCLSKFGISAFDEETSKKNKIRPILISYGNLQRSFTNGTYWISKLKPEIDLFFNSGGNVALVTDLRFKEFEFDEFDFIRSYKKNFILTISRLLEDGKENPAAHESEEKNFRFFLENSDMNIKWETHQSRNTLEENAKYELRSILNFIINK